MTFFKALVDETEPQRQEMLSAQIIERCFKGEIDLDDYVAFLVQAYHHVKHTVPLLMSVGARLPAEKEWLRTAVAQYIEEELGHQEWILNDIAACGYDKEAVRLSAPSPATELMVAYAYDMVQRVNPLGFFGMVHVLEGTSINLADKVAGTVKTTLGLSQNAFTYLISHGSLDQDHVVFFEKLMNRITDKDEQAVIIHACKIFYQLYGGIFRTLSSEHNIPLQLKRA
ncbi:MAG: biliverdin-producing heme oxygenase [SAR86 cluster bacterium]|uniref:Biliverdin-producing heme oxygenase n=1 Tax=SAR86 cluster bacterium TaxID=2030880 RepID=A0A2A5AXG4_9GAMM|nr:MAG: biliverdin-producing heme oxygenase [SAR86 cluster bacterium]